MIGRQSFTAPEWQEMQTALIETSRYIILAHPGLIEDIKDTLIAKNIVKQFTEEADSEFIYELTDFSNYQSPIPRQIADTSEGLEPILLRAITNSVAVISKIDPNSAILFKELIVKVANGVISSAHTPHSSESIAYNKVLTALSVSPQPDTKEWDPKNPLAK